MLSLPVFKANVIKGKCLHRVTIACKLTKIYSVRCVHRWGMVVTLRKKESEGIQSILKKEELSSCQRSVSQVYYVGFIC